MSAAPQLAPIDQAEVALTPQVSRPVARTEEAQSLLDLEQEFDAVLRVEGDILPSDLDEFQQLYRESLVKVRTKRDATGFFLRQCDVWSKEAKELSAHYKNRATFYERVKERVETWVETTIRSLDKDKKGKFKVLEGDRFRLMLIPTQDVVLIEDESAIPSEYKRATAKFKSAAFLERLISCAVNDPTSGITRQQIADECAITYEVRKDDVKTALQSNIDVPGADMAIDRCRLAVK